MNQAICAKAMKGVTIPECVHAERHVFRALGLQLTEFELLPKEHCRTRQAGSTIHSRLGQMRRMRVKAIYPPYSAPSRKVVAIEILTVVGYVHHHLRSLCER